MKNNIEILRNPFIYQIDKNTIMCDKQIEKWEDDYISEEYLVDMENGYYAYKYTKKKENKK